MGHAVVASLNLIHHPSQFVFVSITIAVLCCIGIFHSNFMPILQNICSNYAIIIPVVKKAPSLLTS